MPYTQKLWQDRIKDGQGNIVQEGTPFSAGNMNRIEQGVADAHASLNQAARQTQSLNHGLNVVNGGVDAPVSLQIEGRTLIPMQNTVLDAAKYYVLADKKTKIKWADATIQQGIYKFTGKAEKPTIIRVTNFENKVAGSTLENPNIAKRVGNQSTLQTPAGVWAEATQTDTTSYSRLQILDGSLMSQQTSLINGNIAQQLFSFDIISVIERQLGKIPRVALADKVQWCKDNLAKLTANWHGYGSSVGGNKATFAVWVVANSAYGDLLSHVNSIVTKISHVETSSMKNCIESNGFVNYLAYAEASDGVTASTIFTDYVELEIELKPDATLHAPRVPLYEVTKEHYDLINVTWSEQETLNRYPMVEGAQHLQNPYVMAEGENLLPPFSEWTLTGDATIKDAITINTKTGGANSPRLNILGNQVYTISRSSTKRVYIYQYDASGTVIRLDALGNSSTSITITTLPNAVSVMTQISPSSADTTFEDVSNMMFTLGSTAKPFVPRNPSYLLAETKLGSLNGVSDRLYEQDGKYMVRKAIEKDVALDGSLAWAANIDYVGYKRFKVPFSGVAYSQIVNKFDGKVLKPIALGVTWDFSDLSQLFSDNFLYLSVSDVDSGFADAYTPTTDEIKSYFNGWKKTGQVAANPTAAPTLAVSGTTGALEAVTHYVKYTWETVNGETLASPIASIDVAAGQQIDVTIPALPGGVLKVNVYIGTTSGSETKQGSTTTTTFTQSAALVAGGSAPATNTTADRWASIVDASAPATQTAAYCAANKAPNYIPYKLSYQLATPVVSEAKIEGAISVNGLTQVELGSGVIVREKIVPTQHATSKQWFINEKGVSSSVPDSPLKYRVGKVLNIYKGNTLDKRWSLVGDKINQNGFEYWVANDADFDTTAEYYVTYLVLDKPLFTNNATNTTATFANNIRTALDDAVKKVEDVHAGMTINTNILYEVLKRLKAGGL